MTNSEDAIQQISAFQRFGSKLGLERIQKLLALLGNPQDRLNVIHVAGTNGKGSVCRYIYSVLRQNGYTAGIYISPFIEKFHERIECNGEYITDEALDFYTGKVMEKVEEMLACGLESPTEFEVVTAIAFQFFADREIDFLVLEVGLGGIGDSTNVVKAPLVSVITSIGLDHTDRLGTTLPEIAREKAGIIKSGCPVVINVSDADAAKAIAAIAYERRAPLLDVKRLKLSGVQSGLDGYKFNVTIHGRVYSDIRISMPGMHQVENAACALTVIDCLREMKKISTTKENILDGMWTARQPGRFEVICRNPYVILDGAHNESGAAALAETVKALFPGKKAHMVFGVMEDKHLEPILAQLAPVVQCYMATEPDNARRMSAEKLCRCIQEAGKPCEAINNPIEAVEAVYGKSKPDDLIIVAGSLFLLGTVRRYFRDEKCREGFAVL